VTRRIDARSERAQALTETAIVLPILCLVLFAILQFGILFNNYLTITDAARAGARLAAVSRFDGNHDADVVSRVRQAASDLDQTKLQVPPPSSSWQPGSSVTVTVKYPYEINLLGLVVKSGYLTSQTTERVE
jgi:archaellum component FlaF (FlaF/FlaG flagellin family)